MRWVHLIIFSLLILWGCDSPRPPEKPDWQDISGRGGSKIYRARVPLAWEVKELSGAALDTTKPIAEYAAGGGIRVTVHNFPGMEIPPGAQVMRWKGQMASTDPKAIHIGPCSHGGFAGLMLSGPECLAWAMQMDPDHKQKLGASSEMKSSYTIKATGPPDKLSERREEIIDFAMSFELIEEIPK